MLRKSEPNAPRGFKAPWVPFVPIMGIIVCVAQMASLPLGTWMRLLSWMAIGFVIYFTYGKKHSKVRKRADS
jgi:APA family basic amino acid/polyamine antiporter